MFLDKEKTPMNRLQNIHNYHKNLTAIIFTLLPYIRLVLEYLLEIKLIGCDKDNII